MARITWTLCMLLFSALACSAEDVHSPCTWNKAEPGFYGYCNIGGLFVGTCQNYINYTQNPCKDPNKGYELVEDYEYPLKITVHMPLDENLFHAGVKSLVELTLVDGNLTVIPKDVYKMGKLTELTILRNGISTVNFYKFLSMPSLTKIDLAHNQITTVESDDDVTIYNSSVKYVDLSYNLLEVIPNYFVKPFLKLEYLSLSHNKISSISELAFDGIIHLETLDISHNMLKEIGNVFPKLPKLRELSLSNNQLIELPDSNFEELSRLEKLDISSNKIQHINLITFDGLVKLKAIDVSNNKLAKVGYAFSRLTTLQEIFISHNNITKLLDTNFIALSKLEVLDVSYNDISFIETNAFQNLVNLKTLDLGHNELVTVSKEIFANNDNLTSLSLFDNQIEAIEPNTFKGKHIYKFFIQNNKLAGFIAPGSFSGIDDLELNLSVGNITSIGDEAFEEMTHLKYLNLSTNAINNVSYFAFSSLTSLNVLDLSYNKLQKLNIASDSLKNLNKLYAQHNNIENIETDVFGNFASLQILDLSFNAIKSIEAHQFLNKLTYLDLSSNTEMKIVGDPFNSITQLNKLSLRNVKSGISFENASTSVRELEMQSCGIIDLNIVYVYKFEHIIRLNLSMNEIAVIDRNSFKSMPALVSLDLSLNKITFIQPGSFLQTKALNVLNLYGNSLKTIQYGVFDGLDVLSDLNLAKNSLSRYDVKLKPVISKLFLDDNYLTNFNFKELFNSETIELSIGGNLIPCDVFAELKYSNYSEKFTQVVKAKALNYYTENINGISCQNLVNDISIAPVTPNPGAYMNPLMTLLKTSLDQITVSLQNIGENTHKTEESMKDLIESSNSFLVANNEKLTNITNQLEILKKFIAADESNWNGTIYLPINDVTETYPASTETYYANITSINTTNSTST